MSIELIDAGNRLVEMLTRENAALEALDLPRAAAMLADKQQAVEAFAAARIAAVSAASRPLIELLAHRLQALAEENRLLLERSIAVQSRFIGIVARAASRVVAAPCYGAGGAIACAARPTAMALSARA